MSLDEILKLIDLPALALELYPTCKAQPSKECRGVAVWREGERDSVSFFKPDGVWLFKDFATDISGNAYTFLIKCAGHSNSQALELLKYKAGVRNDYKPKTQKKIVATYDYTDEKNTVLFQVVRYDPKGFKQRTPDGKGGWVWKLGKVRRVLYRLPKLIEAKNTGARVVLVEGEKDVQRLESEGFIATTAPMGAKKWRKEYSEALRGLDVIISPDNDPKGWEHAEMVARALVGIAKSVKIIRLPNLKEKQDISDWFDQGGTTEELDRIIAETPEFENDVPTETEVTLEGFDTSIDPTQFLYTDVGNGDMLIAVFGSRLKYAPETGWYWYDGKRWALDKHGKILELAKQCNRYRISHALTLTDTEKRDALLKHAMRSDHSQRIKACVEMAKTDEEVTLSVTDFDTQNYLLNVNNGTINLNTGELLPHNYADLITKLIKVDYRANAKCPAWLKFQNSICQANKDLVTYKQRAFGYSLTGDTSEQCFFICYGTGANGKSTELETIRELLGDYARATQFDTFAHSHLSEGASENIARLRGARMVSAIESESSKRLAEALIKQLTGGDAVTARFLYKDSFEFRPNFKIWLATNHRPDIRGTDHGIWRRVQLIPYEIQIPEEKRDKHLARKLRKEAEGILAWLVAGCVAWQKTGLEIPNKVKEATQAYRDDMDILSSFLNECCHFSKQSQISRHVLYKAYKAYCEEHDEYSIRPRTFYERLREKGCHFT